HAIDSARFHLPPITGGRLLLGPDRHVFDLLALRIGSGRGFCSRLTIVGVHGSNGAQHFAGLLVGDFKRVVVNLPYRDRVPAWIAFHWIVLAVKLRGPFKVRRFSIGLDPIRNHFHTAVGSL